MRHPAALISTFCVALVLSLLGFMAPAAVLGGFSVVFDAVYTPLETRLLREAKAAGCEIASGLDMFVGQAARQFELFTGKEAKTELMRNAVLSSMKK